MIGRLLYSFVAVAVAGTMLGLFLLGLVMVALDLL